MSAVTIETRVLNKEGEEDVQTHEVDTNGEFTCIVHPNAMHVNVMDFVEINPEDTQQCVAELNQVSWEWIRDGGIFLELWKEAQDPAHFVGAPKDVAVLQRADRGVRHMAGLIILACEAAFAGQKMFIRTPEAHLHPANERYIMSMFIKLKELTGGGGNEVATEEAPEGDTVAIAEGGEETAGAAVVPNADAVILKWLEAMRKLRGDEHIAAEHNGKKVTYPELIELFGNDEEARQMLTLQILQKYGISP